MSAVPASADRERGGVVLLAVIIIAVMLSIATYMNLRLTRAAQMARNDLYANERLSVYEFFNDMLDCEKVLAPYSRTNICPHTNAERPIYFFDQAGQMPATGPEQSTPVGNSWPHADNQWHARVTCDPDQFSLKLELALWNTDRGEYVTDPVNGQLLNFNHRKAVLAGGDSGRSLCNDFFGGLPASRLYSMDIFTLQKFSALLDTNGKLYAIQSACDGRLGVWPQYYPSPACQNSTNTGMSDFCQMMITAAGTKCTNVWDPNCQYREVVNSRIEQSASCERFCQREVGYAIGRPVACLAGNMAFGPGVFKADDSSGQASCLCMK